MPEAYQIVVCAGPDMHLILSGQLTDLASTSERTHSVERNPVQLLLLRKFDWYFSGYWRNNR